MCYAVSVMTSLIRQKNLSHKAQQHIVFAKKNKIH